MGKYLDLNHPSISEEVDNFIMDINRMFEGFQEHLSLTDKQREELKTWIIDYEEYQVKVRKTGQILRY